jgi:hypothetical protein
MCHKQRKNTKNPNEGKPRQHLRSKNMGGHRLPRRTVAIYQVLVVAQLLPRREALTPMRSASTDTSAMARATLAPRRTPLSMASRMQQRAF